MRIEPLAAEVTFTTRTGDDPCAIRAWPPVQPPSGNFRIVAVQPNRPKFAIEGECVHTEKRMLFTAGVVKAGLLPVPVPA